MQLELGVTADPNTQPRQPRQLKAGRKLAKRTAVSVRLAVRCLSDRSAEQPQSELARFSPRAEGHPNSCHPVREPTFCRREDEFEAAGALDSSPA